MEHLLWYKQAGRGFNDALPLGNGSFGAMVFGGADRETVQLNDDTLWGGKKRERHNPEAAGHIEEIRQLLMEGEVAKAQKLAYTAMTSIPKYFAPYQPLGDFQLWMEHSGTVSNYSRRLDLSEAVATVEYDVDGIRIKREYFVSHPRQLMVIHITSSSPVGMYADLMRRPFDPGSRVLDDGMIAMCDDGPEGGIGFACVMHAVTNGRKSAMGDFLCVEDATETTFFLCSDTTYRSANPLDVCLRRMKGVTEENYAQLRREHVEDYQALFNRVSLDLGGCNSALPTDERLSRIKQGEKDIGWVELVFNFGRYLMISGSRPDSQAMNLQGIWNHLFQPPWECNYTININTEMNYWPAEVCNLSECAEPLFDLIDKLVESGRETAKKVYGLDGFVAHHCTDIWGDTAIEGIRFPSPVWLMGGAWLSLHLWEHYKFGLDAEFLKNRAYPVLKECVRFFNGYLTEAESGWLMTGPSVSPENRYRLPDGSVGYLCMAPEMDNQILRELYSCAVEAAQLVGEDNGFIQLMEEKLAKIRSPRINSYGGIMEWREDYAESEPGHRHMSHLFSLHPGTKITPLDTPELAKACEKTLEHRMQFGGGHTGWSCAWIINFYARLCQEEDAEKFLYHLFRNSMLTNLFDDCPPFEIDGNFGVTAGIAEMLLQSHAGFLHLLPALPAGWVKGSVRGLRARGGMLVDIRWEHNAVHAAIRSKKKQEICVRCGSQMQNILLDQDEEYLFTGTIERSK